MTPYCSLCSTPLSHNSVEGVYCVTCCDVARYAQQETPSIDPETLLDPREVGEMRWQELERELPYLIREL